MSSRVGGRSYDPVYDDRDYYRDGGGGSRAGGGGGRRGGRDVDEVDVDITRTRDRDDYARSRGPDFLREDYGRSSTAGPLVLAREEPRRRPDQRYEEEEILIKRATAIRDVPRGTSSRYEKDDIDIDVRETEGRSRARPRGGDDIDIDIRRDADDRRPSRRERDEIDIDIRDTDSGRSRRGPPPERDELDIRIRESNRSGPPPPRSVVDREEIDIKIREESGQRRSDRGGNDITFRRGEGERSRPTRDIEREDITIRRGDIDDSRSRRRDRSVDRINIDIREGDRGPTSRGPRSTVDREEIDIRIREEERRKRPDDSRNTLVIREKSRERSNIRPVAREREDYYFRRRSPSPPPPRHETEEIIIRRRKSLSPSPSPPRAPSPPPIDIMPDLPPIVRPPIHQEIITHHRHIDHGHARAPSSSSSSPSPPPQPRRKRGEELEIDIKRRDARGNTTQEDIRFVEEDFRSSRREREEITSSTRHRSRSAPASKRDRSRHRSRSRSRSRSRDRNEKLQLSIDINNSGAPSNDRQVALPRPPMPLVPPTKPKEMWTEITKDLVSKEAIEYAGFQYEETVDFFYVMEYLRYEDVTRLVELSEDLYRDRHNRIEQIQWERKDPRLPEPRPLEPPRLAIEGGGRDSRRGGYGGRDGRDGEWDERIYEREVIYEDGSRRRYRNP